MKAKPEGIPGEYLEYLDNLRESGVTNMWGASSYLEEEFGYTPKQANTALLYWMETFGERHAT